MWESEVGTAITCCGDRVFLLLMSVAAMPFSSLEGCYMLVRLRETKRDTRCSSTVSQAKSRTERRSSWKMWKRRFMAGEVSGSKPDGSGRVACIVCRPCQMPGTPSHLTGREHLSPARLWELRRSSRTRRMDRGNNAGFRLSQVVSGKLSVERLGLHR